MTYRVYVCGGTVAVRRTIGECHGRCQRRRRLIVEYDASPYYAPTTTCVACGDAWAMADVNGVRRTIGTPVQTQMAR